MNASRLNRRFLAPLTLALALTAGAAVAAPPAAHDLPSVKVRYGDLDLTRDEGVRMLYARLRAASREVCPNEGTRYLHLQPAVLACYETTLANAVAAVHNERLAALHSRRTGGHTA